MSSFQTDLEAKIAEMRRLFDRSFAAPMEDHVQTREQMLAITVAGEPFAVRVLDITGVTANKGKVVPVPSSVPELLGITGVRGTVVPVFSLAALLGFPSGDSQPGWLLLCGGQRVAVALAFDQLEGHFEVPSTEIYAREAAHARRYVNETARHGAKLRGVISAARLTEAIKGVGASALNKY